MSAVSKRVFLLPGEMHYAKDPISIATLLGSCVAICLLDQKRHFAGMNHYLLPTSAGTEKSVGKCGDLAISQLVKLAKLSGSPESDVTAMIIGGGAVTGSLSSSRISGMNDVGDRNIAMARQELSRLRIPVLRTEVGGTVGRRVLLDVATGKVQIENMQPAAATTAPAASGRPIKVLIVDDSATVRGVLKQAVASDPSFQLCGEAADPFEARDLILSHDPDVICLDIIMPNLDGVSFLKRLMSFRPIPTVIVSTIAKKGSEMERNAKDAGAVAVVDKETLALYQGLDVVKANLLPILRKAAATAVQKRP
jgi:two-component system, chemotaxis family, protein-glutamate methylesterase/glutaminase